MTDDSGLGDLIAVGIDAGGSRTRARALRRGLVVHEGFSGPANPTAADPERVAASFQDALKGCPPPARIVAAVAGAGSSATQARLSLVLKGIFPAASVRVVPDYAAAFVACPSGTDVCVIAGTGSVVCSPNGDDEWRLSGGRGWLFGDHGSAAYLGMALLRAYVNDPDAGPPGLRAAVADLFDTDDWRVIVRTVQMSPTPARLLAAAAPIVTRFAEEGEALALAPLREGMDTLASTAARHVAAYLPGRPDARIALAGGVWTSPVAVAMFADILARYSPTSVVDLCSAPVRPIDGALSLALAAS